jgi:hypothetical protein
MVTGDRARATRANAGGETNSRSEGGVGWGLLKTAVLGIKGNHCCSANGSSFKRQGFWSERVVEAHISIVVNVLRRAVKISVHEDSAELFRGQSQVTQVEEMGYSCIPVLESFRRIRRSMIWAAHDLHSGFSNQPGNYLG